MRIDIRSNRRVQKYREGGFLDMFKQFLTSGKDYFGSKPDVPKYPTSSGILDEMLRANAGALPGATHLAGQMDTANLGNWTNQVNKISPDFMGSLGQEGKNIASRVAGNIPQEVSDAVQRSAAARSFLSGTGGGADTSWMGALTARDLGRTGYDIQRQGEGDLERFGGVLKGLTPTTDVRSLLFSPAQVQNVMEQKWNEEWLRAKIEGAPDPVARGRADQEMALFATIMSTVGGMVGGGKGGGSPSGPTGGGGGGGSGGGGSTSAPPPTWMQATQGGVPSSWNMGTGGGGWSGGVDYNNPPSSPWGGGGGGLWG